jgi:type I restriction enzyme M protein
MAKRHRLVPGDWDSIIGRLEELVLANSGEDEFQEVFKLLVAKLYAETHPEAASLFAVAETPEKTAGFLNELLGRASRDWKGILADAPVTRLVPSHLAVCVEAIEQLDLLGSHIEVLDAAFESLISRSAKGAKGQYFTPRHVIEACVRIIDPKPVESVADPACGSAGFLVHTLAYVRDQNSGLDLSTYAPTHLWGFDFDARVVQVAKALMLIAGDGHSNIYRLNSLSNPLSQRQLDAETGEGLPAIEDVVTARNRRFKGFDVILTNPPFAGEVREAGLLASYAVARKSRKMERDVLFLERCVQLLRPGGRLAIVLPHNKLGSGAWAYLREWVMKNMAIIGVLGLGRNTFLPHTAQKADVLFAVKRSRPTRSYAAEEALFVVSERDGKNSKGQGMPRAGAVPESTAWERLDHDLDEAVDTFRRFMSDVGEAAA